MTAHRLRVSAALGCAAVFAGCVAIPFPRGSTYHGSDADLGVTRVIHGSLILELGHTRLLLDPWFHSSFLTQQKEPLGLTPDAPPATAADRLRSVDPIGLSVAGSPAGFRKSRWPCACPVSASAVSRNRPPTSG